MNTKYYYDKDDITTGPFTLDQLVEMEHQGLIRPETRILVEGNKEAWTTWAQVLRHSSPGASTRANELSGTLSPPETDAAPWCWAMAWVILVLGGIVTVWALIGISGLYFRGEQLLVVLCMAAGFAAVAALLYALGSIVRWMHIQSLQLKDFCRHRHTEQ